jgi:hypothetical protein
MNMVRHSTPCLPLVEFIVPQTRGGCQHRLTNESGLRPGTTFRSNRLLMELSACAAYAGRRSVSVPFSKGSAMGRHLTDLTGRVFGRLTVISRAENARDGRPNWNCVCSCENRITVVSGSHLAGGYTKSCGCLHRETAAENARKAHSRSAKRLSDVKRIKRASAF